MMNGLALLVVIAAVMVSSEALSAWSRTEDYIDYAVLKTCFGEDAIIEAEVQGVEVGRRCLSEMSEATTQQETFLPPPHTPDADADADAGDIDSQDKPIRRKRNLLKYPPGGSIALQLCNIRGMNLTTGDGEVNTPVIQAWIENVVSDFTLKTDLLDLMSSCLEAKGTASPVPPLESDPEDSLIYAKVVSFLKCLNRGGLRACKDFEERRYAHVFGEFS